MKAFKLKSNYNGNQTSFHLEYVYNANPDTIFYYINGMIYVSSKDYPSKLRRKYVTPYTTRSDGFILVQNGIVDPIDMLNISNRFLNNF